MKGLDLLSMQLRGSCTLVVEAAESAEDHWTERAFPGASLPGFIVWHSARIIDWGVNTVVRGENELAASMQWSDKLRFEMGHGAGLSDAEADDVAASVRPDDVAAYATGLLGVVTQWFESLTDTDLDVVPDLRARNQNHARYAAPQAWAEIKTLADIPAWQVLARPCVSHVRMHMGELDVLLQQLRVRPLATPALA